jgi:hypothetical protein
MMKHIGLALLAFSVFSFAQSTQPASDVQAVRHEDRKLSKTPTAEDMYCGGFITTQRVGESHRIVAGQNSPDQARYAGGSDRVFILGTSDVKPGDRMEIVRPVRNPNRYETYTGQNKLIKETGQAYFERGYVRVLEIQKNVAIAMPELSCADILPGDLAIPFVERETPEFRHVTLDRFTPPNGKATGRIVLANEFDTYLGSTQKVYLSIGEDKGLKVGDYLRVTRTYDYAYREPESNLSALATDMEDTAYNDKKIPRSDMKELPRLTLGDVIVLSVHPRSATAMIVTALEDIRIGDGVEVMDGDESPTPAAPGEAHQ